MLARIAEAVTGWKTDEHYVGTADERKARKLEAGGQIQDDNAKFKPALGQMQQILGDWKLTTQSDELAHFCDELFGSDDARPKAIPVVDASVVKQGAEVEMMESRHFPAAQQIAEHLVQEKGVLPCFLLHPSHPQYVPPHVVAFWLMSQNCKQTDCAEK